jgi:hypothetical protein
MGTPKAKLVAIEHRRAEVAEMYLRGQTQMKIADHFGVDQKTISTDIAVINKRWQEAAVDDRQRWIAQQLARIDFIEREAISAWERSIGTMTKTTKSLKSKGEDGKKVTIVEETMAGDPRFLDRMGWCVEQRLKVFGGYAPTENRHEVITRTENQLEEAIRRLGEFDTGGTSNPFLNPTRSGNNGTASNGHPGNDHDHNGHGQLN